MKEDILRKSRIVLILILSVPLYSGNSFTTHDNLLNKSQSSRTTEWILDFQQNDLNNTQWYFDHLNDNDRKKIRQALDWAIPRDYITNTIMDGMAIPTTSSVSPYFSPVINSGPKPRTYNLTQAGDLLAEVFGYRFNQFSNDPSTTYDETKPYFKMTQFLAQNYPQRIEFASEIKLAWQKIGIKVDQQDFIVNDVFTLQQLKNDSVHGGYDAYYIGYYNPSDLPFTLQYNRGINGTLDSYIKTILGLTWEPNSTKKDQVLLKYQNWIYDNVPKSYIIYHEAMNAKNKYLMGFNPFTRFNYENWTFPGKDSIVIALEYIWGLYNLNPIFNYINQLDYYDGSFAETRYSNGPIFRGMFFSTTEENDSTFSHWKTYPYFANWYNTSADGKTWFVNLKEGLKWHDGVDLNASDVEFTFNSIPYNIGYPGWDYSMFIKKITVLNSTMIKFEFNQTWLIKETILSTTILPKHILENIPKSEWPSHTSNTGLNGSVVGNGPYIFVNKSSDSSSLNLQKWVYWNDSYNSLIKNNKMGEPVPGITVPSIKNIKLIIDINGSDTINGIKNGSIDIKVGPFFEKKQNNFLHEITDPAVPIFTPSNLVQELAYNLFSPIWGLYPMNYSTPTDTPITPTSDSKSSTPSSDSKSSTPTSDSNPTSDFNVIGLFSAFMTIAIISIYSKRKKSI